ncbi:MAG: alpha/beta hydrolase family protein [Candidatus Acidiferrales bacterium]
MDLYVIRPRNVKKPPVVLYLYTWPEDTERFTNAGWCTRVTGGGYAAIGFVSALTGHRFHDRPMREWFVSEFQESLGKSVHDVQMILNYLSTRDDLDVAHVGMFGEGSGGSIAVLAAAADSRIKAIDVLDPWGDWPDWLAKSSLVHDDERANFLKPEFLASVAGLDPVQWLPKLKSQHIRIQDNQEDPTDPQAVQKAIEAAAPENAEINQFGDARALGTAMGGGELFAWIKGQVRQGAEIKTVAADQRVHVYPAERDLFH